MSMGLAGCSTDRTDLTAPTGQTPVEANFDFVGQQTTINNYNVHFDGRLVSGGNTTFTYTVTGTGAGSSMTQFTVELCGWDRPVDQAPLGRLDARQRAPEEQQFARPHRPHPAREEPRRTAVGSEPP